MELRDRGNRARSADRYGPRETVFGELAEVLRELRNERPAPRPEQFKPPHYNGDGDVELFIQQFTEVAAANQWNQVAALLHLREALQDGAKECGRPATIEAALAALRSRYGLTTREARSKLSHLKKDAHCTLHEHATQVEKLVRGAFGNLPEETQADMMLETFCSSLGNAALQRHLLAVRPETLTEAIQHGNEFLQVKAERPHADHNKVRAMGESEEEEPDQMATLMKAIQRLAETVDTLQKQVANPKPIANPKPAKEQKCWGCQKTGHTRKDCTTHPWPKAQGNGDSPQ